MNFLKSIKSQIYDPRMGNHSHKERVLVNTRDLRELIDNFEKLDTDARSAHEGQPLNQRLAHTLEAVFHQNEKDGEITLLIIMETLRPLIEERRKQKIIEKKY